MSLEESLRKIVADNNQARTEAFNRSSRLVNLLLTGGDLNTILLELEEEMQWHPMSKDSGTTQQTSSGGNGKSPTLPG